MDKQEILDQLKVRLDNISLRLPKYIEFSIEDRILKLHLSKNTGKNRMACLSNMQEDEAAFEGWSVCLKYHLSEFIDTINLSWGIPNNVTNAEQLHYNRFLYRVIRFKQMFPWSLVSEKHETELLNFENSMKGLFINSPEKEPGIPSSNQVSEKTIEYDDRNLQFLKNKMNLKVIDHQLPVGVFKNRNPVFTGKGSGIDIWGLDEFDKLSIFELKYNNRKVGVIAELLFYCYICHDVFLTGNIKKPQKVKPLRGAEFLYDNNASSIQGIKAYFLTDQIHPLVEETTELLNSNSFGIHFLNLNYKLNADSNQFQKLYSKGDYQRSQQNHQSIFRKNQCIDGNSYFVSNGSDNLFEGIRTEVTDYFDLNQIEWWSCKKNQVGPTTHMLSSQIQCVNFLFLLRKDKDAVLQLAQLFDPEIDEVYPSLTDQDQGLLSFEFIFENKKLLNEASFGGKRGKYLTSIDVFLIAGKEGKKWLVPIEWKYSESYLVPENKTLEMGKGQTRQTRYNDLIADSKQLKTPSSMAQSIYYVEPYYELMRQTLLVEKMVELGVADDFLHILVTPDTNKDLLQQSYGCIEQDLIETWKTQLKKPDKFRRIESAKIFDLLGQMPDYSALYEYLKLRYY